MRCSSTGWPPTSSRGLGTSTVCGYARVPFPPQRTTVFISGVQFGATAAPARASARGPVLEQRLSLALRTVDVDLVSDPDGIPSDRHDLVARCANHRARRLHLPQGNSPVLSATAGCHGSTSAAGRTKRT